MLIAWLFFEPDFIFEFLRIQEVEMYFKKPKTIKFRNKILLCVFFLLESVFRSKVVNFYEKRDVWKLMNFKLRFVWVCELYSCWLFRNKATSIRLVVNKFGRRENVTRCGSIRLSTKSRGTPALYQDHSVKSAKSFSLAIHL